MYIVVDVYFTDGQFEDFKKARLKFEIVMIWKYVGIYVYADYLLVQDEDLLLVKKKILFLYKKHIFFFLYKQKIFLYKKNTFFSYKKKILFSKKTRPWMFWAHIL